MPASEHHIKLEGLTDGVFAIVMTLLVLGLGVPVFRGTSTHQEFTRLLEMWPEFTTYVVTFLMLGFSWSVHHQVFRVMKRSDSLSDWINIICLMFISLLPFSTSLLARNMGQQLPLLVYEGNFLMSAIAGYINWSYVTGKYRLVDRDIDPREVRRRKITWLTAIIFIAIAMGVSYLNTIASLSVFVAFIVSAIIHNTLLHRVRTIRQMAK
jgi:uncharacterized membrane protein